MEQPLNQTVPLRSLPLAAAGRTSDSPRRERSEGSDPAAVAEVLGRATSSPPIRSPRFLAPLPARWLNPCKTLLRLRHDHAHRGRP